MEILVEGIIVKNPNEIESCALRVTDENYKKIREKLIFERTKLINYLKELKNQGLIKSIYRPKNKQLKNHLKEICKIKKNTLHTIEKLDTIFK